MRHYALYDHRWTKIHRPISAIASAVAAVWCVSMAPWCAAGVQKKTCV